MVSVIKGLLGLFYNSLKIYDIIHKYYLDNLIYILYYL